MKLTSKNKYFFRHCIFNDEKLTRIEKLVLLVLVEYYNEKYGYSYPSYPIIMKACGIGRTTLSQTLKSLKDQQYINYTQGHTGKNNRYQINDVWSDSISQTEVSEEYYEDVL